MTFPQIDRAGGYVTDAGYVMRFHRALNPRRMGLALTANGYAAPDCDKPYTYMELGFGQGATLAMLAAANPHARFFGVDLLSEHVAHAQGLAEAAELNNIEVAQISFSELQNYTWPPFDFIVLHGVWTWIDGPFRVEILKFIKAYLKPGGVAYVSYNAMPGWASMEPLRSLMKLEYDRARGEVAERVRETVQSARSVQKAQSLFFRQNPTVDFRLNQMDTDNPTYLAHEYFNAAWKPFYFDEVAAEFASIGLDFVASASLQDNVDDFTIRPEAHDLYDKLKVGSKRETFKDFMLNRLFRRDLYVRSPCRLGDAALTSAMAQTRFASLMSLSELAEAKLETEVASGKLNAPVHRAMIKTLSEGPQTVQHFCTKQEFGLLTANAVFGTFFLLAAMNAVEAAVPDHITAEARGPCNKLNAVITSKVGSESEIPALVSPIIGAGVEVKAADQNLPTRTKSKKELFKNLGIA